MRQLTTNRCLILFASFGIGIIYATLIKNNYEYISWLIFALLPILFWFWVKDNWQTSFLSGALFGFGVCLFGLNWLYDAGLYFGVEYHWIILIISLIYLLISLLYSFAAILIYYLFKLTLHKLLFVFGVASIWFLLSMSHSHLFGGLPYLQNSYILINTPLSNLSPYVGSIGVDFIIAIISGTILLFFYVSRRNKSIIVVSFLGFFMLMIKFLPYQFTQEKQDIDVLLMNDRISMQDKQKRAVITDRIKKYIKISKQKPDVGLIVWPESSIPNNFYNFYKNDLLPLIKQGLLKNVLLGTYTNDITHELKLSNTILSLADLKQKYNKQHLAPFGEYIPPLLRDIIYSDVSGDLGEGGNNQKPIKINKAVIAPLICFEILFDRFAMQNAKDSNLIVALSDLSWFKGGDINIVMDKASRYRAKENQKFFIRADNFGNSVVINDNGKIIKQAKNEKYIQKKIKLKSGLTPYARYHNNPLLLFSIIFLLFVFFLSLKAIFKKSN